MCKAAASAVPFILCSLAIFSSPLSPKAKGPLEVRQAEFVLRKRAVRTVAPVYPTEALKRHLKGVAVARLQIDTSGRVSHVDILQAPGPEIAKSVSDAVRQWRFKVATMSGQPVKVRGKLTFYFVIDHRKGVVRNSGP